MTKFRDGFMMKSPLPKHQKEFYDEAERLSKESGTPGDYDRDNPEVRKQLDKAEEAEKSHKNDGPIKMATASYRRTPMDTETYYGGEIDVPDITSVGKLAGIWNRFSCKAQFLVVKRASFRNAKKIYKLD